MSSFPQITGQIGHSHARRKSLSKILGLNAKKSQKKRDRDVKPFGYDDYDAIPTPRINEHIHMHGISSHKLPIPTNNENSIENITFSLIHPDDIKTETKMPEIKSKSKRKHEKKLPEIITEKHGAHFINEKPILPPISKTAGKRRTRKNKPNRRRRTLKK